jgi:hypothetical protein
MVSGHAHTAVATLLYKKKSMRHNQDHSHYNDHKQHGENDLVKTILKLMGLFLLFGVLAYLIISLKTSV